MPTPTEQTVGMKSAPSILTDLNDLGNETSISDYAYVDGEHVISWDDEPSPGESNEVLSYFQQNNHLMIG